MATLKNTTINDTSHMLIPQGTNNQKPGFIVQMFTADGANTFSVPTGVTSIDVLVVGGGGSTGGIGGGGGGGGVVYYPGYPVTPGGSVPLSIGTGGAPGGTYPGPSGSSGTPTTFGALVALGGGGGGSWNTASNNPGGSGAGGRGHSGSGSTASQPSQPNPGATVNAGFPGAAGGADGTSDATTGAGTYTGGGGGGAGGAGGWPTQTGPGSTNANTNAGRQGGIGYNSSITGLPQYFGGGGGGASHQSGYTSPVAKALGGTGGGGRGASIDFMYDSYMTDYPAYGASSTGGGTNNNYNAVGSPGAFVGLGMGEPGQRNTGGGGGGGWYFGGGTAEGGRGGPGVVIVRYNATGITATVGMTRFNTDGGFMETFDGSIWRPVKRTVMTFAATGGHTFKVPIGVTHVDVLVVAGGGSGGILGGGGGAGGHIYQLNVPVSPGGSIPITVGTGGRGEAFPSAYSFKRGQPSRFGGIEAFGGGAGGTYTGNAFNYDGTGRWTSAYGGGPSNSPSHVFGGQGIGTSGGSGGGDH